MFRRVLIAHLADLLVFAFEVGRQRLLQLGHGQLLLVEHQVLDGHQSVGGIYATDGDLGDRVVVGPAGPGLGTGLDASAGQEGAPGAGEKIRLQDVRNPGCMAKRVLTELELLFEGRIQFFEVLEVLGIAGLGPDLLFGAGIETVVHGQLENFAKVGLPLHRVTGLIREVASHAGPDTGASSLPQWEVAYLVVVAPEVQSPFHHHISVDELRKTNAGPDHIEHFLDELAGGTRGQRTRERRLGQSHVSTGVEDYVVHFRSRIIAVLGIPSQGDTLPQIC